MLDMKEVISEQLIKKIPYKSMKLMNWLTLYGFQIKDGYEVDDNCVGIEYRFVLPDGEGWEDELSIEDTIKIEQDWELRNAKDNADIYDAEVVYIDVIFINAITNRFKVYITSEVYIDTGQLKLDQDTQSIEVFVNDTNGIKALYKMLTGKKMEAVKC